MLQKNQRGVDLSVKGQIGVVDAYLTSYFWQVAGDERKIKVVLTGSIYEELIPVADLLEILFAVECVSQAEVNTQTCVSKTSEETFDLPETVLMDLSRRHLLAGQPMSRQLPLQGPDKCVCMENLLRIYGNTPGARKVPLIVLSGCFDLFHANHARLLSMARNISPEGRLIVFTLSDSSIARQEKNVTGDRPLYPIDCRTRLLSALQSVDHVVVLDAPDCVEALNILGPDLFVKNSRDKNRPVIMAESRAVEARGGQTVYITQAEKEISTTQLVNGIRAYCRDEVRERIDSDEAVK